MEFTDEFDAWWDTLGIDDQQAIDAAVRVLEHRGAGLGRPLVDSCAGSRHPNIKELRDGTSRQRPRLSPPIQDRGTPRIGVL